MWMETFIATVKQHHALVIDTTREREFDLNDPEDETAFGALCTSRPR
jgi:hypothetical protein